MAERDGVHNGMRHGGRVLIEQLEALGARRAFCVPGESFLAALDALHDSPIDLVVARQEGGAAMMAEAHGKLTGAPGLCFVTRGPGATNASAGVHVAMQDSTPMILFIGQVPTTFKDREAFQEVDLVAMFRPLAKWAASVDRTDRIPEYIARAWSVATSGRPGPVVLALPEDVLSADAADVPLRAPGRSSLGPKKDDVEGVADALRSAERPLLVVGGPGWSEHAATRLRQVAERWDLPVVTTFRCQDYLANDDPRHAGDLGIAPDPALASRVRDADMLLVLGARLGEMTTSGYALPAPDGGKHVFHVHPDPDEPNTVYPAYGIASTSLAFLDALFALEPPETVPWSDWTRAARAEREAWIEPRETPGALKLENVVRHVSDALPSSAIVCNGAGNYAAWVHRYHRYGGWPGGTRTQLAPTSGSMGYGLPAAIAAKLHAPEREVVCYAGDGCFQMTCQEFGTACEVGANIVVVVCDNGRYGTIAMHQERSFPDRPSGTTMRNPDFAAWARSYGALGETVERDGHFPAALERARAAGTPSLIHLKLDPRAVTPNTPA